MAKKEAMNAEPLKQRLMVRRVNKAAKEHRTWAARERERERRPTRKACADAPGDWPSWLQERSPARTAPRAPRNAGDGTGRRFCKGGPPTGFDGRRAWARKDVQRPASVVWDIAG